MKLLIQGWYSLPHSYAIVNCFQMRALARRFPDLEIFIQEPRFYLDKWKSNLEIYPVEMREFLENLKAPPADFVPDVVYRISFPYNIAFSEYPTVVFYTHEMSLTMDFFTPRPNSFQQAVSQAVNNPFTFVCPSEWSSRGLKDYLPPSRNVIIPHGVATDIFYRDETLRDRWRELHGVSKDQILFLHAGAMTQNKGTFEVLLAFSTLVRKYNKTHYRLVLKCSQDLYETNAMLAFYTKALNDLHPELEIAGVIQNFTTIFCETFSFSEMNALYNGCDVYLSPFSGEGFNLMPLEAIASGMHVMITNEGGAKEYVSDFLGAGPTGSAGSAGSAGPAGPATGIYPLTGHLTQFKELVFHKISVPDFVQAILENEKHFSEPVSNQAERRRVIESKYSWDIVACHLMDLFQRVEQGSVI